MHTNRPLFLFVNLMVITAVACSLFTVRPATETTPQQATPTAAGPVPTPPVGVYAPAFARFQAIPARVPAQFKGVDYSLPVDLQNVLGADELTLSDAQKALMIQNGFVVLKPEPGKYQEFYQIYESGRYGLDPTFITTDSVYHIYHLIFDKMLRDLERDFFIARLETLTQLMLRATYEQYTALKGSPLEEPALRNVAYFAVAARLLDLPDPTPAEAQALTEAELALINATGGPEVSPLWDRADLPEDKKLREDYSQYIPRGHYTRSEALKKYFRAMMWYGRLTFRLRDAFETRRALLMTQALRSASTPDGVSAQQLWQDIYEPTAFIVGKADDLSFFEYGALMDSVFGMGAAPLAFADEAKFADFMRAAETLPPPQVNSMWVWIWEDTEQATKGFRFMGQRFTLDAYVFGQLIWRKVGTMDKPRGLPKGLDFLAAMGSEESLAILKGMGETDYQNFDSQMAKVRSEVSALEEDSWTQNLYWSWLYSFQPLIEVKDARYPSFMRTQAWTRKEIHTALGSWTELKHDTILYAKQVMAEMGGGGPEERPRSYVEPNAEAYARLQALAVMTRDGLSQRGLLSDLTTNNLTNLISELQFLQAMSEAELNDTPVSEDDLIHMLYWGGVLEQFTLAAADTEGQMDRDLSDQKAALIADVATGTARDGTIAALEEAIGHPAIIYVVIPGETLTIGRGAVFTYYEFPVPVGDRMTDEQWQAMVEAGANPAAPGWTNSFIAP